MGKDDLKWACQIATSFTCPNKDGNFSGAFGQTIGDLSYSATCGETSWTGCFIKNLGITQIYLGNFSSFSRYAYDC